MQLSPFFDISLVDSILVARYTSAQAAMVVSLQVQMPEMRGSSPLSPSSAFSFSLIDYFSRGFAIPFVPHLSHFVWKLIPAP